MKRLQRILLIGCLHSSMYLYILPKLILPRFEGDAKDIAKVVTVVITIILTMAIVRLPKYLKKRADKLAQEQA